MKRTLSIIFSIFCLHFVTAQRLTLPTEYIRQKIVNNNIPTNTIGSRYFTNVFVNSKIYLNDQSPFNIPLRYDPINDEMQMQQDGKIIYVNKINNIKIELANKKYKVYSYTSNNNSEKGYFQSLNPGETTELLLQERKKFIKGKKAINSYTADTAPSFQDYKVYYLKINEEITEISLSKRKFLKYLRDKEKDLKKYISKNKLKFKEENDFIKLIKFYNNLKNN